MRCNPAGTVLESSELLLFSSNTVAEGTRVWDTKGSGIHVLKSTRCDDGSYCGMCGGFLPRHQYWSCECGKVYPVDYHHYRVISGGADEDPI